MSISIVPNSATITLTTQPHPFVPTLYTGTTGTRVYFGSQPINAVGAVQITGAPGDSATGWSLGFLQAQWAETNWLYYRGENNTDGSMFFQRARPPARAQQVCQDVVPTSIHWYDSSQNGTVRATSNNFPILLTAQFYDAPHDNCAAVEMNSLTGKPNYLQEVQLEFLFCTVLAARSQPHSGPFTQLLHFYWNVRWQFLFQPVSYANAPNIDSWLFTQVRAGAGANVGQINSGAVTDQRFQNIITSPQQSTCTQIARNADSNPNIRESPVWDDFNVFQ